MRPSLLRIALLTVLAQGSVCNRTVILILSHGSTAYDEWLAGECRKSILDQDWRGEPPVVVESGREVAGGPDSAWGHYAVWPIIGRLVSSYPSLQWLLIIEPETRLDARRLHAALRDARHADARFRGHGLVDKEPVITHHFFYTEDGEAPFEYPDFAAGVVLNRSLVVQLARAAVDRRRSDFTIDPKHEFARFVLDAGDARLHSEPETFCLGGGESDARCAVWFEQQTGAPQSCLDRPKVTVGQLFVAIKTFSAYHRSRVVVAKRTWTARARNVVYYSDVEDEYVPTVALGVPNTQRGHCAKTMAILERALKESASMSGIRWLVVADDDTLIGLSRLLRWLRCYDSSQPVIIGERYGYGYGHAGTAGYDYPTGGAGMVFSLSAAQMLHSGCACPAPDSPDDMIIGMCARQLGIPIVHAAGMHQARARDYPRPFLTRVAPLSLHKHEGIDPYDDYMKLLHEREDEGLMAGHDEL